MSEERARPEVDQKFSQNYGQFSDLLDRFFEDTYRNAPRKNDQFIPQVNVSETESHYYYEITLPGMRKEEIHLVVDENTLTISGERKPDRQKSEETYHLVENQYGSFNRTLTLPKNANVDSIEANYENGILRLSVEKNQQGPGREIKVK